MKPDLLKKLETKIDEIGKKGYYGNITLEVNYRDGEVQNVNVAGFKESVR